MAAAAALGMELSAGSVWHRPPGDRQLFGSNMRPHGRPCYAVIAAPPMPEARPSSVRKTGPLPRGNFATLKLVR